MMEYKVKVRSSSIAIETFVGGQKDYLYLDIKDELFKLMDTILQSRKPGEDIIFTFSAETIPHANDNTD